MKVRDSDFCNLLEIDGLLVNPIMRSILRHDLLLQVSTVGVAESKFSTGVLLPQVFEGAVAQKAGIQEGDTIMKLNGRFMKPSMTAVNDLVNYIKWVPFSYYI